MKRKNIKSIAMTMSLVMLFTSCSGGGYKFNYDTYANSEITTVENKSYVVNGENGTYTGGWKGDRPEGNGEFVSVDNDIYKGDWKSGFLSGQGEIIKTDDGGVHKQYIGICGYNNPYGEGEMTVTFDDNPNVIRVKGDFSPEGKPLFYYFDETGRLVDIGDYADGNFVSYLNNFDVTGVDYIPPSDRTDSMYYDVHLGADVNRTQRGEYFGEMDSNGLPNGYGYLRLFNDYTWNGGSGEQVVQYLGEWKDGECDGLVMWFEDTVNTLPDKTQTSNRKAVGSVHMGRFCDERVLYTTINTNPPEPTDGLTVETEYFLKEELDFVEYVNVPSNYQLCDDGLYRTLSEKKEYYYNNGKYGYSTKTCVVIPEDMQYALDNDKYVLVNREEGEYCNFDADGNVTDYGIFTPYGWQSTKPVKDNTELKNGLTVVGVIAVVGLSVYIGQKMTVNEDSDSFKNSSAGQYLANRRAEISVQTERQNKFDELIDKAEEAAESGDFDKVDELLTEASDYHDIHWF
ncbi:MAG: hypothetical protein IKL70_00170 [Oscillospiraceae bacterium]|nr:hypothetical protein [Oscillospiraceae bacterium]